MNRPADNFERREGAIAGLLRYGTWLAAIIIAAFLPLFTLSGVEGNIFGPMARTYAYALAGGLLATFTVTPALSAIILPSHVHETETWIMRFLHRLYVPALNWAVANRNLVGAGAIGLVVMTLVLGRLLGLEFLPKLEEGNLWIRATLPPTISLEEGNAYVNEMRKLIRSRPEVEAVVSQHGRPDDGTDAAGLFNAEFFAPLKPVGAWPGTHDKEVLTAELLAQLQDKFPGVEFNFSQYLQDNVSEAVSGVKGENSIKLYGNDLDAMKRATETLVTASQGFAQRLYDQAAQEQAASGATGGGQGPAGGTSHPSDDEVVDAEIVDEHGA